MLIRLGYKFSKLRDLLSNHCVKILDSNPTKYQFCKIQMQSVLQKNPESEAKKKLNLCFNIANTEDYFNSYKSFLYSLVNNNKITTQSDLDRLLKWITYSIKSNNKLSNEDILSRIENPCSIQTLRQKLNEVHEKYGQNIDISKLSKEMRDRFPTIDSKLIYEQIRDKFNNILSKQDRQIWDKLSELKPRLLAYETNDPKTYEEHLKITNNQLRFRFPPEPNGYLHIGHCKSIRINFQTARRNLGICFLRFDDTNPESESTQFIEKIIEDVKWMGYSPYKITYASDYFQELQNFAIQLIKLGKAYVCETSKEEIHEERKNKKPNPYRDSSIQFSLQNFPNLKSNQTLRLKLNHEASNPTLRDPIIYRRKDHIHPRTGNKYKIYPTYDYAHCICDSLEHIDYSLCSLQFEVRRELYYTILNELNLYKPIVWEYSRLNIEGNILSKRKITKLVNENKVSGWSDPRLLTISGLKNRGYTPQMITSFIDKINVARAGNQSIIQYRLLQLQLKKQLFKQSERSMAILNPMSLYITNLEFSRQIQAPLFPEKLQRGKRKFLLKNPLFIENTEDIKIGDIVNLKYFGKIEIVKIDSDKIEGVLCKTQSKKLKNIHWISEQESVEAQITQYRQLFNTMDSEIEFNQQNFLIYKKCRIPKNLDKSKVYQFQRLGYYKYYQDKLICCTRI